MGASSSKPEPPVSDDPQHAQAISLVLHALPVFIQLTRSLSATFSLVDKRRGFLQNFRTAATILLDRLAAIDETNVSDHFAGATVRLARLLEELLDVSLEQIPSKALVGHLRDLWKELVAMRYVDHKEVRAEYYALGR